MKHFNKNYNKLNEKHYDPCISASEDEFLEINLTVNFDLEGRYLKHNSICNKCKIKCEYVYNLKEDDWRHGDVNIPWYCEKCHPAYQR